VYHIPKKLPYVIQPREYQLANYYCAGQTSDDILPQFEVFVYWMHPIWNQIFPLCWNQTSSFTMLSINFLLLEHSYFSIQLLCWTGSLCSTLELFC